MTKVEIKFEGKRVDSRAAMIGIGYTLATGRVFTDVHAFHRFAEELLGRPVYTHELGDEQTWTDLREAFETWALEQLS